MPKFGHSSQSTLFTAPKLYELYRAAEAENKLDKRKNKSQRGELAAKSSEQLASCPLPYTIIARQKEVSRSRYT